MTKVFPEKIPFNFSMKKACLPHEYFNFISDLDLDHLPPEETFCFTLKDSQVTDSM